MKKEDILERLKAENIRKTTTRMALLDVFFEGSYPLSVAELLDLLGQKEIRVNKTTVYREVDFLVEKDILEVVTFAENQKRYELKGAHHHHLVCRGCGRVEKVEVIEAEVYLTNMEQRLQQETKFGKIKHALEFFGMCRFCL